MMHVPSRHQPWWRKKARLGDSSGAVCAWCRTRWEPLYYSSIFTCLLAFLICTCSLTNVKNQFSVVLLLYKSPLSLCSQSDLNNNTPQCSVSLPTFRPFSLSSFDAFFLFLLSFTVSPSLSTKPLYFPQKESLYFSSHCLVLPQSGIPGSRMDRDESTGCGHRTVQKLEWPHNGSLSCATVALHLSARSAAVEQQLSNTSSASPRLSFAVSAASRTLEQWHVLHVN